MKYDEILNYVGGKFTKINNDHIPVYCPYDGSILAEVEFATVDLVNVAVENALLAQNKWKNITYKKRTEVIFNLRDLLMKNSERLSTCIHLENGKTIDEANADVLKAIELCEFAVSIPALISGKTQFVSTGIEVREIVSPVGIVASITPFNFPLMVPMWTIPNVLVTGNAMILKPSEKTPITASILAELLESAGVPEGLFTVLNGGKDIVEAICDHKDIQVVTFVGSTQIAESVYKRAISANKRCLALGGAKNHILVTDDINPINVAKEITSAAFGMAGQRCMAASVVLTIGNCEELIKEIVQISTDMVCGRDIPPLISTENVEKIANYLKKSSGEILADGRQSKIEGDTNGYYIGPSVILYDSYSKMPKEEVFGPTIEIIKCNSLEEAIEYQNMSPYANGASIFTESGLNASKAIQSMSSGMLGVNIGIPVPRDPFSFGGLKSSKFGYGDISGYDSIKLFTNIQKVTTKWDAKDKKDWAS